MQQNIFNGEVAVYFQTPLYMVLKTSDQKGGSYIWSRIYKFFKSYFNGFFCWKGIWYSTFLDNSSLHFLLIGRGLRVHRGAVATAWQSVVFSLHSVVSGL